MPKKRRRDVEEREPRPLARTERETATAEAHVRGILRYLGEDPEREGLLDTPARVVRAHGASTSPATRTIPAST